MLKLHWRWEENLKLTPRRGFTSNILGELCILVRKGEEEIKGKKIKLTELGHHFLRQLHFCIFSILFMIAYYISTWHLSLYLIEFWLSYFVYCVCQYIYQGYQEIRQWTIKFYSSRMRDSVYKSLGTSIIYSLICHPSPIKPYYQFDCPFFSSVRLLTCCIRVNHLKRRYA